MISLLKTYLLEKLDQELPGRAAHIEVAPSRRISFDEKELLSARESGVLILFYLIGNEPHIVLMQRPTYEGAHSGQVSFPGGKAEESDRDIIHTALREANEEVGVVMADVDVVGKLSDVYIPVSNFNVSPIVGFVNYHPQFIIDAREVKELIELKLSDLTDVRELRSSKIMLPNKTIIKAPSFNFNDKIIWGATALMLNELRWVLKEFDQ
jgi:8-oxo-dGTP pyrophosphatase MutT (NUDIX family)